MVSIEELEEATNGFFDKFCKEDLFTNRPIWSYRWNFINTLPNNDKKGCYAHLKNDEVVYVGLAIGNTNDGSGIGARVSKYWKKSENYSSTNQVYSPKVKDITAIITIPFEDENFYLAAALEVYLIRTLKPHKNVTHKYL